ncbi:MAG: hypothetical protein JRD94_09630, partial [Deltaproteobacteria bacterium]|nr:hypothetical protein [Deltaproteobacteria bacterium]
TIGDPNAQETTYTCAEVGDHSITITISDDDFEYCMDDWTVPVTCVEGDGGDLCEGVDCDDVNQCTDNECNPASGACINEPVQDGTPCDLLGLGDGVCEAGECVEEDLCEGVTCDDTGNDCTVSMCNIDTGVCDEMNAEDGTSCDGGAGACSSGVCMPAGPQVDDVIVQVATLTGITASLRTAVDCPASTGGPDVMTMIFSGAIAGGSIQVTVESSAEFQTIIIVVSGLDGCWELTLPAGVTIEDLLVTLGQDVDQDFVIGLQAGDMAGNFGGIDESVVVVEPVPTSADVQVSLSFDQDTDLDLYVDEPDGTRIFFGNPSSSSGGTLDLDSNPACSIDGINQENISWSSAPSGEYIVLVDYYQACVVDPVISTVTIFSNEQLLGTFTESFVASDVSSGSNPREVTRFTVP